MTGEADRELAQVAALLKAGKLNPDDLRKLMDQAAKGGAHVIVEGPGSVATSGGVSSGAGGVAVGGDIHGDVYVGPPPENDAEALAIYRRMLMASMSRLPLRGVRLEASDAASAGSPLELARVYVDLDTKTQVPAEADAPDGKRKSERPEKPDAEKTRPLRALEAAVQNHRLVILGDPGSGKSTFINHLCLCLAADAIHSDACWMDGIACWPASERRCLPIPVVLRDFAAWVKPAGKPAGPGHLLDFIKSRLEAQNLADAAKPLEKALNNGHAAVLLDGLDEVPTSRLRTFIRDAVTVFALRYPKSRYAVTCRVLSYQDAAWWLDGFPVFELAPFSQDKIDAFIKAWYADLMRAGEVKSPEQAGEMTRRLKKAVRGRDLRRLAPNPLLLTVMALVHTHKGRLPEARARLYEETVEILLWRWEQQKLAGESANGAEDARTLRELLSDEGRDEGDLKGVLGELAFKAHSKGDGGDAESLADIEEYDLRKALAVLAANPKKSLDWAFSIIETIKLRAGLLLEPTPERYCFPHRTFQEYLAGAHLAGFEKYAVEACRLAGEGAFWREVILLSVGYLTHVSRYRERALSLVFELCPESMVDDDAGWRRAWLAGDALLEMGLNRARDTEMGQKISDRVIGRLLRIVEEGRLTPKERVAAGNALSRLGDPRFDPEMWYLPREQEFGFRRVPAGKFWMGSDPKRDRQARDEEQPYHEVYLPEFLIGRYPVTLAQFRAFVKDSKYKGRGRWDDYSGEDNHPVVGVTWHDAMAYCKWLTEKLRSKIEMMHESDWVIRLPTEAEWEKAARGADGRIYPWNGELDVDLANFKDTGIKGTSPVGCFPRGVSPYECLDMSGNVWEWTHSLWGKSFSEPFGYPYKREDKWREDEYAGDGVPRVVRGGAYFMPNSSVRCASRYRDFPLGLWGDLRGFRVVCAPGF